MHTSHDKNSNPMCALMAWHSSTYEVQMEIHQHKVDLPKTFGQKTMVKHHPMP
jgi:hypothetical protein